MGDANIVIEAPVKGQWAIMNPPGHPNLAFDFVAVDDKKRPYNGKYVLAHLFARIPVTATYAWSQPVYAPFDAEVVAYSDGNRDRERIGLVRDLIRVFVFRRRRASAFSVFGGNYLVLMSGPIYALFAHLRCGSLRVRPGDSVRAGEQIGAVGNSGISIQPHLHFQIMRCKDPFASRLLPFRLRVVQKRVVKDWKEMPNSVLHNGDHLWL